MADLSESMAPKMAWARPERASEPEDRGTQRGPGRRFIWRRLNPWRVLYIQYTNPGCYPPLQHSSRILADAGWNVSFFGTESFGSSSALSLSPDPRIRITKLSLTSTGVVKLHYLWFCLRVVWRIISWQPAWLYASDILSCPPALLAATVAGTRVVFHEHDTPHAKEGAFNRLLFWARAQLARRACLNILPSACRAKSFQEETRATSIKVVWNCPSVHEIGVPKRSKRDCFVVYYHGNISPKLLPITAVTSLKFLPQSIVLRIVGYETAGNIGYSADIFKTADSLGVGDCVFILPAVSRLKLMELCREGDVGLAFFPEPKGPADSYAGASNKVFDYLCCGLPVLIPNNKEWQKFFYGTNLAVACNPTNAASIAEAILWLYRHPNEAGSMGERGRERILRGWNYEEQFSPVLRSLTSFVPQHRLCVDKRPSCLESATCDFVAFVR